MTDLTARAVIMAVDRFSGPVGRMAGSLAAFNRAGAALATFSDRTAVVADRAKRFGHTLAGPMALGLGAMIYRTQEFERAMLGIQMAGIAATNKLGELRQVDDINAIKTAAEATRREVIGMSAALKVSPTELGKAAEAAAKIGVASEQTAAVVRNAAIWNMAEHQFPMEQATEFLGKLATQFNAPQQAHEFNAWIASTADKIATVAAASPTNLATFSEGMRQFAAAFGSIGGTIDQANAILGTMTMMGQADIESGTAVKMGLVRLISPTLGHLSALNKVGIDRTNYLDITAADPRRAVNQLVQLFPGYIGKNDKTKLYEDITAAVKAGRGAEGDHLARVAGRINKLTGGKETIEDTYLKVASALTTSGGKIKFYEYLRDAAGKGSALDDASFIEMFSKFHFSRMKALLSRPDLMDKFFGLSESSQGQGQETRRQLYQDSPYGRWEGAMAALTRALARLRESEGITNLITSFERVASAVASMPPAAVENLGMLAASLTALGVTGLALGGVASGFAAIAAAMSPLGLAIGAVAASAVLAYQNIEAFARVVDRVAAAALALVGGEWSKAGGILRGTITTDGIDAKALGEISTAYKNAISGAPMPLMFRDPNLSPLVRDIDPTAGPPTMLDITGRVQAEVAGTLAGRIEADIRIHAADGVRASVEGQPGGEVRGSLNTGKSMGDIQAP